MISRLALRALVAFLMFLVPLALAPDGISKSAVIVVVAASGAVYGLMMLVSIVATVYLAVQYLLQLPEYGRGLMWANNGQWFQNS